MLMNIAKKEGTTEQKLKRRIKNGSVVLVKNSNRDIEPLAIGEGVHTKINANIGTSSELMDVDLELEKAKIAVRSGADTLMDLSIGGDLNEIKARILKETDVPLGTVPIYDAFIEQRIDMDIDSILRVIERQCEQGVDFMTIHAGITQDMITGMKERIIPITSRGGSFVLAWMIKNQRENPLYEHFDLVLDVVKEHGVVISLGDALRPAATEDATDILQIQELVNLGKLTQMARKEGVGIIIEGPGHVPLNQIEANVILEKKICDNAPFYVLGPLVTDIALGYDHISGAIGGAIAAMHGADFLCYVTPAEHLGLPSTEDVREGVIASKIAAHAADMIKLDDRTRDLEMSNARKELNWHQMFELSIDTDMKTKYSNLIDKKACTMSGEYCALKIVEEYLRN